MSTPNLYDFDCVHLGVSGGKDSTAVLLWLAYESGVARERIDVTFCDTGNEDPLTYAYLDLLSRTVLPIKTIVPERDFWELAHHKKRFPSPKARFCTIELKVIPTRNYVMELLRQHERVVVLNGVRRAEGKASNNRGSAADWELDIEGWAAWIHRPLASWSISDVWDTHRRYLNLADVIQLVKNDSTMTDEARESIIAKMRERSIPSNPLYYMGATRVGCYPCHMARKSEIRAMTKYRPERIDFIEAKELSFTHTEQGISTFFRPNTVPMHLRSCEVVTTTGRAVRVPTIRDVAEWSQTARGGRQFDIDFEQLDPASACDIGGLCE